MIGREQLGDRMWKMLRGYNPDDRKARSHGSGAWAGMFAMPWDSGARRCAKAARKAPTP